jgi:hypothetical protein
VSLWHIGLGFVLFGSGMLVGGICGWRSGWEVGRKELIRFQRQHQRAREQADRVLRPWRGADKA